MKNQLRQGSVSTLNIYSVSFNNVNPRLLGYATFPWDYSNNPRKDGIVLKFDTVPGGANPYSFKGVTLTHEIGRELSKVSFEECTAIDT